ncbi:MAG: T3SS (YopN, CesT) and YbjN peptide-binding chaperone 1 [Candidatus Kapaibacteriota bacterium]
MGNINNDNGVIMETNNEVLTSTIHKVENFLKEKYPDYIKFDDNRYTITRGSTAVMILIRPYTEDDTIVEFVSNMVFGAKISPELMNFLLRKNAELHFGAFGLLFDGTIVFTYSIAGKNLDENEFVTALNSVAIIADYYDNEIIAMAGGKTAMETLEL